MWWSDQSMLYPSSWLLHQVKYTLYFVHAHAVFCYSVGTDKHFLEMLRGNVKQTIEMDGGGMGRDFWQKYRIGKELLTEKKLFMCRRVQTNLANTRGIYSVGSALPRSSWSSSTSLPSFFSSRSPHHLDPHDPLQHHLHHQKLCTPCTTSDGRTLFWHYCVFHSFCWFWHPFSFLYLGRWTHDNPVDVFSPPSSPYNTVNRVFEEGWCALCLWEGGGGRSRERAAHALVLSFLLVYGKWNTCFQETVWMFWTPEGGQKEGGRRKEEGGRKACWSCWALAMIKSTGYDKEHWLW